MTAETNGQPGLKAEYFDNPDLKGAPVLTRTERNVNFRRAPRGIVGELSVGFPDKTVAERWTGYYVPKSAGEHDIFVESTGEDGGSFRLSLDDKVVLDNWTTHPAMVNYATLALDARPHKIVLEHRGRSQWLGGRLRLGVVRRGAAVDPQAKALAAKADVVVVAAGFDPETESEAADRTFRLPPGQDELIREMAAANRNTIVVLTSGGGADMSAWLERVPALVAAWYPGQEGGTARRGSPARRREPFGPPARHVRAPLGGQPRARELLPGRLIRSASSIRKASSSATAATRRTARRRSSRSATASPTRSFNTATSPSNPPAARPSKSLST